MNRTQGPSQRHGGKHGLPRLNCWRFAPVAQGIEQRFPKPRVGGSNPSRRTPKGLYLSEIVSSRHSEPARPLSHFTSTVAAGEAFQEDFWRGIGSEIQVGVTAAPRTLKAKIGVRVPVLEPTLRRESGAGTGTGATRHEIRHLAYAQSYPLRHLDCCGPMAPARVAFTSAGISARNAGPHTCDTEDVEVERCAGNPSSI